MASDIAKTLKEFFLFPFGDRQSVTEMGKQFRDSEMAHGF